MAIVNIICTTRMKWWVRPLIGICAALIKITRSNIIATRSAEFIGKRGIKIKTTIREV
ncbi:hypothetical protein ACLEDI_00800 [Lonsdalea quercina]|uniref:hypothetical protein n=1 Tax=Lonsdalea quercina TaxID=71657 RepID=UPI0039751816